VNDNRLVLKESSNDMRSYLRSALKNKFGDNYDRYIYVLDFDPAKGMVQFEVSDYTSGNYKDAEFQVSYTMSSDVDVVIGDEDPVEVVRKSTYVPVSINSDNSSGITLSAITKTVKDTIKDMFSSTGSGDLKEFVKQSNGSFFIEKFNNEEMVAYEPMYAAPGVGDSDAQAMSEETIKAMVDSANKGIADGTLKPNLFHKVNTDCFSFVKAFVNPWPNCTVGEQEVVKGQPVIVTKYNNEAAWELRKAGTIKGPSIGGMYTNLNPVEEVAE